jgi:hypothetical protein
MCGPGYVHRQLHEKTVVSEDGIGQFLATAAALQQYKQTAILYTLLASGVPAGDQCRHKLPSTVVTVEVEEAMARGERLVERCGEKVRCEVAEPLTELVRLGIVQVLHKDGDTLGDSTRIRCQVPFPFSLLATRTLICIMFTNSSYIIY